MLGFFLMAIVILVAVHEYGHFWVARRLGVKILRYSIGFGRVLLSWHDRHDTQYVISAIPLGGYVKMLDEREGAVADHELHRAFNRQPIGIRMCIILAGPLFNLLFAIFAYWLMFCIGITQLAPIIGGTEPGSIVANANIQVPAEIISIGNEEINSWTDVRLKLLAELGSRQIKIVTHTMDDQQLNQYQLDLHDWQFDSASTSVVKSLGIIPAQPNIPPVIDKVLANTPAENFGLQIGDKILMINGITISSWYDTVAEIAKYPGQEIQLRVKRSGQLIDLTVTLAERQLDQQMIGYLGVQPKIVKWPDYLLRKTKYSPLSAVWPAVTSTWNLFTMSWQMLGKMIVGDLSFKAISGPVGIAQGAGYSASLGFSYYLNFLALVSISLAVVNLLPIPLLDGGHLLYCALELITRRPVSERLQMLGVRLGLIFLIAVMLFAFYNDVTRW